MLACCKHCKHGVRRSVLAPDTSAAHGRVHAGNVGDIQHTPGHRAGCEQITAAEVACQAGTPACFATSYRRRHATTYCGEHATNQKTRLLLCWWYCQHQELTLLCSHQPAKAHVHARLPCTSLCGQQLQPGLRGTGVDDPNSCVALRTHTTAGIVACTRQGEITLQPRSA